MTLKVQIAGKNLGEVQIIDNVTKFETGVLKYSRVSNEIEIDTSQLHISEATNMTLTIDIFDVFDAENQYTFQILLNETQTIISSWVPTYDLIEELEEIPKEIEASIEI